MSRIARKALAAALLLYTCQNAISRAADWPQYRGPNHDGISTESVNLPWPSSGPKVIWKVPTPNGFSSFTVSGGEAFTQVSQESGSTAAEMCMALDAKTGKMLWAVPIDQTKYQGGGDSV